MRCRASMAIATTGWLLVAGCAPARPGVSSPVAREDAAVTVARLQAAQDEVLADLAAVDRRIEQRAGLAPRQDDVRRLTIGAVLAEDPTLAVVDGAIDPFSFDARARGLAAARAKLDAAPRDLPARATGAMPSPALERELLGRLVDEEIVRLDEERALPRSASALVRAVVETWRAPASPEQAAERDRWLARRLGEIGATLSSGGAARGVLDVTRARELDDSLDSLERAAEAAALARATAELVKVRDVLDGLATRPASPATSDWPAVSRSLRAHLGWALPPEELGERLASLEKTLRGAAEGAIGGDPMSAGAAAACAAPLVFAGGECAAHVRGSRLRSMAPPPERAPACKLREAVAAASNEAARRCALLVLHDHVVVAQWAIDVARGTATIGKTTAEHRPLSRPTPELAARWERLAIARPATAIGAGLAAGILYGRGDGGGDIGARARAWSELGEVPLDIVARELGAGWPGQGR